MINTQPSMAGEVFRSHRRFYGANIYDSQVATATPGIIETPDGRDEIAVAVLSGRNCRLMLAPADAMRVAIQIADALEALKKKDKE